MKDHIPTYKSDDREYYLSNQSTSEYQNQRHSATKSRVSFVSMQAGLKDKLKTLIGNFKFEYSLTKDDIRRRKLVKNQVMIFESSSMPVDEDDKIVSENDRSYSNVQVR